MFKKFPVFDGNPKFIVVFTKPCNWTLSWASSTYILPHILFQTHCKINLQPNLFSQEVFSHRIFLTAILFAIITSRMHATFPVPLTFMHK